MTTKKKESSIKNYRVLAKVTVESWADISATSLADAATKAEELTYGDFVASVGELYEAEKPEITSLSVE